MSSHNINLLLGTNLGDKNNNLKSAKTLIQEQIGNIFNETKIIETEPVGFSSSNFFLNQIIQIETNISPINLLKKVKSIEQQVGRIYTTPLENENYTDRKIDIDILNYDNIVYISNELIIPHPRNFDRKFVQFLVSML